MSAGTGSRSAQPSTPSGIRACLRSCSTVRIGAHHCRSHRGAQASAECGRCGRRIACAGRCVLVLHGLACAVSCALCDLCSYCPQRRVVVPPLSRRFRMLWWAVVFSASLTTVRHHHQVRTQWAVDALRGKLDTAAEQPAIWSAYKSAIRRPRGPVERRIYRRCYVCPRCMRRRSSKPMGYSMATVASRTAWFDTSTVGQCSWELRSLRRPPVQLVQRGFEYIPALGPLIGVHLSTVGRCRRLLAAMCCCEA